MARSRKSKKLEPAVQTLSFTMVNNGSNYIDLSRAASALNRRFYRQGLNWAVSSIQFTLSGVGTGTITASKIPNTWMSANSWKKTFTLWNKQQMDALADSGSESSAAAFRDFKIYLDEQMVGAAAQTDYDIPVDGQILVPHDAGSTIAGIPLTPKLVTEGEWEYSEVVIPNFTAPGITEEFNLHMVGKNTSSAGNSRGVIEGYAHSRAYPQSPDPVSPNIHGTDNWMREMFDVGEDTADATLNATTRNDELPYAQVEYPGGETNIPGLEIVGFCFLNNGTQTGVGQSSIGGTNFPCGLIRLDSSLSGGFVNVQVRLVPGMHRGYLAESMQDM